jgi:hypothetical protein
MKDEAPKITMCDCQSSQLAQHGYDPATKTLAVKFKNGGLYHYAGVSQEAYDALTKAKSLGKHFAANVRSKFRHEKIGKNSAKA